MTARAIRLLGLATDVGFLAAVAALVAITALYSAEVVLRYWLGRPTSWGLDAVSFLFLISIFGVLPHATRAGGHIAVTLVQDKWPRLAGAWNRGLALLGCLLCLLAGWVCLQESLRQAAQFVETVGAITIPKWWISWFVAYGFLGSAPWFLILAFDPKPREPELPFLRGLA